MQELSVRFKMSCMYMYLMIVVCSMMDKHVSCGDEILKVLEGDVASLDFPYPCNSTRVTLRHGHQAPFYSSANPDINSLPLRYELADKNNRNSDICYLNFTINPVSREDEGTFILIAYKDGVMLPDLSRIALRVGYPPGKASCESRKYVDGEWVKFHCTASMGTVAGQIVCYQADMRLPSLTSPEKNGGTLRQTMLARLANISVYCCSSPSDQQKSFCDCKDYGWDPIQNMALPTITNPCALQVFHSNTGDRENVTTASDFQAATTQPTTGKQSSPCKCSLSWTYKAMGICSFILMTIFAVLYIRRVRENKILSKKLQVDTAAKREEQQSLKPGNTESSC